MAEVHVIYMHQFWHTFSKHGSSYRFKIDNKKFTMIVEEFRDILNICPRIEGQEFFDPSYEEEALSFIKHLGHTSKIKFKIDNKKFIMIGEEFRDILNICPRIEGQEFFDPSYEEEALSFIKHLGHTSKIKYLTDVIVDHLPSTVENICLYHQQIPF
uniref:Uncharacterized protein n=1 Tax=Tanacetum cinerariifolium TaxID=118510 RepID=A0A699KFM3_TANCI|nr:hypothetical protein [Tanacetum cinerariifolium]